MLLIVYNRKSAQQHATSSIMMRVLCNMMHIPNLPLRTQLLPQPPSLPRVDISLTTHPTAGAAVVGLTNNVPDRLSFSRVELAVSH